MKKAAVFFFLLTGLMPVFGQSQKYVSWHQAQRQEKDWYGSAEARRIADNVLLYQHENGGWYKNIDMAEALSNEDKEKLLEAKPKSIGTTIDNGATFTQLNYLAKVYQATANPKYKTTFLKGIDYLLEAQYPNGGWPQYYPIRKGYYEHITYNDNAMVGVMSLLDAVARREELYGFVDDERKLKAEKAVQKGINIILDTQVVIDGQLTVWCAQHDKESLKPAKARAFELASLSGSESATVVKFLMGIPHPDQRLINAIESAVKWFQTHEIRGKRLMHEKDGTLPKGYDIRVVDDPDAKPLWARFYDLQTQKPIYVGRDGEKKTALSAIEYERRVGYSYLGKYAESLLERHYPAWKSKWIDR